MTILKIDSSITGEASVSRQLTAAVVDQLVALNLDQRVVVRDLVATPLSHLTLGGSGDADVLDEFHAFNWLGTVKLYIGAPITTVSAARNSASTSASLDPPRVRCDKGVATRSRSITRWPGFWAMSWATVAVVSWRLTLASPVMLLSILRMVIF